MTDILVQIRSLVNRRDSLLREANEIDHQLAQARSVLGVSESGNGNGSEPLKARKRRVAAMGGLTQTQILEALSKSEPQTAGALRQEFPDITTVYQHLAAMADAGTLVRRKGSIGTSDRKQFYYARSAAAFEGGAFEDASEEVSDSPDPG